MQGQADSTTVTYSKVPNYLQPYIGTPNYSAYNRVGCPLPAAAYITATIELRSTHHQQQQQQQQQSSAEEPHLCDCGITLSPSDSTSSRDEANREGLFRPIEFDDKQGICRFSVPLTLPESSGSSDRGNSNEDDLPDVLLVQIPRRPQKTVANEPANGELVNHSSPQQGITINLLDKNLWKMFGSVGNEMIVTKPGRRLFPALLVGLRGLDLNTEYTISLRISSADPYRYKFLNMQWIAVGESEVMQNEDRQIFCHPNSPNVGQFWMKKPISFKQVKITHNPSSSQENVLLHTMHKYMMEIVLQPAGQQEIIIPIPDTEFVAVTAYQNTKITQLKIDNNPFAKGFRDRENAGFHHPSTLFPPPHSLPSLYGFPSSQTPLWPQLVCRIPTLLPSNGADVLCSRSASPEEGYQKQSGNLPTLPAYPHPTIPSPYPYIPPTSYPHPLPES